MALDDYPTDGLRCLGVVWPDDTANLATVYYFCLAAGIEDCIRELLVRPVLPDVEGIVRV